MDLNALETFAVVVRAGSFAAAARQTGLPRSSISLRIRNLERDLGVRLFKRSTRDFSLTAPGRELYERSADALAVLNGAVSGLKRSGERYGGEIRVTVPADLPVAIIASAIAEFRHDHPAVRFGAILSTDVRNLVSENIDIALRIGDSNPQDAVVRDAVEVEFGFFARADFVGTFGAPSDLRSVPFIGPQPAALRQLLTTILRDGAELPTCTIATDNFLLIHELVLQGQGIGLMPSALCTKQCEEGVLVRVLQDWISGSLHMRLTYPSRADLTPKVSAFGRVLARHLGSRNPIG